MTLKKKLLLLLAFIFISAIIFVVFITFTKEDEKYEYDGTLVQRELEYPDVL